ncbi:MAG: hypothetical protein WBF97_11390 [Comamonas sp.]
MNPRLILARRRAGLHPGFVRAVESKISAPAEIYAYPAAARREAAQQWRIPKVPPAPQAPEPTPPLDLRTALYVVLLALWFVAANVPAPIN